MTLRKVGIAGTGSYVPPGKITNADLKTLVDTTDEWIMSRTGIAERRRVSPDQASSDLGYEASLKALEDGGVSPSEIDVIICATITPDMNFPSTACHIQGKLDARNSSAFDLSAACSGFIYALREGKALVAAGEADTVLVVGAEAMTKFVDYEDRASCILFGDAGAAVVLRPTDGRHEVLETFCRAAGYDPAAMSMVLRCGGSACVFSEEALKRKEHLMVIKGREVYKFAVVKMYELIRDAAARMNIPVSDIDWIVPHQVNLRILEGAAERLGFPMKRIYVNLEKYGNSSAASAPLALDEAVRDGSIRDGDLIVMCAFGAGLTWASATVRW